MWAAGRAVGATAASAAAAICGAGWTTGAGSLDAADAAAISAAQLVRSDTGPVLCQDRFFSMLVTRSSDVAPYSFNTSDL